MVNSFSRCTFSMVMNVKIGSSTATEPMRTQGGTPVQNFLSFNRGNILDTKYSMYPCK